ncbi:hypothetical protein ACFP9V_25985 [Deinococcus radiopugnans]|uniref:Uncharacterized protein n=1 Tax=Deinococcus radiopugnans ATCC 19172 TaxID=585398 RepID=A0ABR6NXA1_9DEIO|nr:hypothetical protein [Deinococcus radiopugnans]MBB6018673.1 hypothetical protein [Deinococcus radiopugnans ATCC 19172]
MFLPFLPTAADTQAAQQQLEQLRAQLGRGTGAASPRLAELLEDLLGQLAAGQAVQVLSLEPEIGTWRPGNSPTAKSARAVACTWKTCWPTGRG